MARITGFLHIWDDPQGKGYHPIQSLVAIATGGWTGLGLGAGVQKYGYLPEARSDFIYAVICEELGIIGGACVMALFGALLIQGYRAMRRAPDDAGRLIAMGGTLMIVLQALINVAVVTVSMPTKGIALPFISAGGSSAMFLAITAGLVANVARQRSAAWYVEQARSRDDAAARTPHANATGQVEPA
jgi:cell division protein FtsW